MSKLSRADRKKLPESDFAGPNRTFPIMDANDVRDAWDLAGKADDPAAVRARIKALAKRKGLTAALPKTASGAAKMADGDDDAGGMDGVDDAGVDISFDEIRQLLYKRLNPQGYNYLPGAKYYSIEKVYEEYFTYCDYSEEKTYKADYDIDTDGGAITVEIGAPVEVASISVYLPVTMAAFTLTPACDDVVTETQWIRSGKIFEAGDYPDKQFSLSPEEMLAAAVHFRPVPIDVEHGASVFDGKLGQLIGVRIGPDGHDLYGEVAFPLALRDVLGDEPLNVSCTWDRASKQLQGVALVNRPRVADAVLFSAFADFAGRRNSTGDQKVIQAIHDLSTGAGATCQTMAQYSAEKETTMPETAPVATPATDKSTIKDALRGFWKVVTGEELPGDNPSGITINNHIPAAFAAPLEAVAVAGTLVGIESDEMIALRAENAAYKAQIAQGEADEASRAIAQRATDAAAFADKMIAESRALPVDRDGMIAEDIARAEDDVALPRTVSFRVGDEEKSGTRRDAFRAIWQSRPAHALTAETLPNGQDATAAAARFNALPAQTATAPAADAPLASDRRAKLLAASSLGQAVLTAEAAK